MFNRLLDVFARSSVYCILIYSTSYNTRIGGAASAPIGSSGASLSNAILEDSGGTREGSSGAIRSVPGAGPGDWTSFPIGHTADSENRLQRAPWPYAKIPSATSNYLHQMLSTFSKNTRTRRGLPLEEPEPEPPRGSGAPEPQEVAADCEIYEDSASEPDEATHDSLDAGGDVDADTLYTNDQNSESNGAFCDESGRGTVIELESTRPLQTPLVFNRPTLTARRVLGLVGSTQRQTQAASARRGLCLRTRDESARAGVQGLGQMLSTIRTARLRTLDLGKSACRSTRKRLEYDWSSAEQEMPNIDVPSTVSKAVRPFREVETAALAAQPTATAPNTSVLPARRVNLADLGTDESLDPEIRQQLQLPLGCVWSFDVTLLYSTDLEGQSIELQPEELFARYRALL